MAAEVLTSPCKDHPQTYRLPGRCANCGTEFELEIPKSHAAPGTMLGWRCTYCGCNRVGASKRLVATEAGVSGAEEDGK